MMYETKIDPMSENAVAIVSTKDGRSIYYNNNEGKGSDGKVEDPDSYTRIKIQIYTAFVTIDY